MNENENPGSRVGQIQANDLDEGDNAQIIYKILATESKRNDRKSMNILEKFKIDPQTGIITTLSSFDRETQDLYTFQVLAEDKLDTTKRDTTTIIVKIEDVNDNKPILAQSEYAFSIEEGLFGATKIGTFKATDADSEANGIFTYRLFPNESGEIKDDEYYNQFWELSNQYNSQFTYNQFYVNPTTGELQVTSQLNREEKSSYVFKVCVNDNGKPKAKISCSPVYIKVLVQSILF